MLWFQLSFPSSFSISLQLLLLELPESLSQLLLGPPETSSQTGGDGRCCAQCPGDAPDLSARSLKQNCGSAFSLQGWVERSQSSLQTSAKHQVKKDDPRQDQDPLNFSCALMIWLRCY